MSKGKYSGLSALLRSKRMNRVLLRFDDIEASIQHSLPPSAHSDSRWWSNRATGLQSHSWLDVGYRVENIDFEKRTVLFVKAPSIRQQFDKGWTADSIRALRNRLGMTQAAFADILGIRQQTVSEWEVGAYKPTRAMQKALERIEDTDLTTRN